MAEEMHDSWPYSAGAGRHREGPGLKVMSPDESTLKDRS